MMTRRILLLSLPALVAHAQLGRREAEWVTNGADAQRSHWIPGDTKISRQSLEKPGFQLLWKIALNNELGPAVLIDRYIGYRGFRSLAFLAGGSNDVYAIDTDLSRLEWQHHFSPPAGCGTTSLARDTSASYPPLEAVGGGLGGRGAPARSDLGDAGQGAVTLAPALTALAREPVRRQQRPRLPALVHVVAGDGMLHSLNLSNGLEPEPSVPFLPPGGEARGLIVVDGIAYAAAGTCGGATSGIRALDLTSKQVSKWEPDGGALAGSAGPAFGPDGTVYATTTAGELVALSPKTLTLMGTYKTGGQPFTSSPVVFPYKGKTLIAAATQDGRIHVVDATLAGGAAGAGGGGFAPGALASWQALDGVRWLLAATARTVTAWRASDRNGAIALDPGWVSRELISPLTPAIINGVVFAVSNSPAVLYALDGATGKVLWDSGPTITSSVRSGGVTGQDGQVYLETYDHTLYAFGFPIEH